MLTVGVVDEDGEILDEREIDLRHFYDLHTANPRTCDDMTSLYYIHEPGVLYNLGSRWLDEDIV